MGAFRATLVNELERMLKRKKAVVAVILSIVVILFGQLFVAAARLGLGLRGATGTGFPILVLSVVVNTLLPLFAALVAIDAFSGEFTRNTMKLIVTRPVSRFHIYLAKACAVGIFILLNLALVLVLSLVTGLIFNPETAVVAGILRAVAAFAVSVLPLAVWGLLVILLANLLRSGTAVFFLSILVFLVFKATGVIWPGLSGIFPVSSLEWHKLWMAETMPWFRILTQFMIMASYGSLFYTTGYYLFMRRDL